jgi:hypothetical protein
MKKNSWTFTLFVLALNVVIHIMSAILGMYHPVIGFSFGFFGTYMLIAWILAYEN